MILQDYLNDKPIKCFYDISFHKTAYDIENNKSGIYYIQNQSRFFYKGDKLPIKTSYYIYPSNFYIYDYTSEESIIHIIKNETYTGYEPIKDISIDFQNSFIINIDGSEILDIKSRDDLYELANHWKICKEEHKRLNDKYFPNGLLSTFMGNTNAFNKAKPLFNKEWEAVLEEFKVIWVKEDEFYIEKRYGVLLEAVKNLYWDLKGDKYMSDKEKIDSLSLAYDELTMFTERNNNAKERYLKLFNHIEEIHTNNIISMIEKYLNQSQL